ncbi:hypothetical protein BDZ91DRAFT_707890 [Kalaharituber pfeilii]|nr:hypothetical protein BDZ91DRAFT_707890 [Kalaharituber pfeilii]
MKRELHIDIPRARPADENGPLLTGTTVVSETFSNETSSLDALSIDDSRTSSTSMPDGKASSTVLKENVDANWLLHCTSFSVEISFTSGLVEQDVRIS